MLHGHGECGLRTRRRMSAKSPWEGSRIDIPKNTNPHNRKKKNRLCGLFIYREYKNIEWVF